MATGILILGFLSLYGLAFTEEFESNHAKILVTVQESPIGMAICMALLLLLVHGAGSIILRNQKNRERNIWILLIFTCVYTAVMGYAWAVLSDHRVIWDEQMISFFADQFANGVDDISTYDINYLTTWPHQLGLIAFTEQIYRLLGEERIRVFQFLNALAASGIVLTGYKMIRLSCKREEPAVCYLLLMLFCWPMIIYVCFFYGEILSVLFSLLAVYRLLVYLGKGRKRDIAYMAAAVTAACLIRSNCYIVLIAMGCVLAVKTIADKKAVHLVSLLACVLLVFLSGRTLVRVYEERFGFELSKGMPSVVWVAMGMQEGMDGAEAGWYNKSYSWDVFVEKAGKDPEKAGELAGEIIRDTADRFREDPAGMRDFYKRKIFSQWNEPTYCSQVETNNRGDARAALIESLYKGKLWKPFVGFMDVYQSVIYCGTLVLLLLLMKKKIPVEQLTLLIVVIGGFLFYLFWEARSRYIFPYFMMMIPMAASGWDMLLVLVAAAGQKIRGKRRSPGRSPVRMSFEKPEPLAGKLILIGAGVPSAFLFLYSLFFTTVYESNELEIPVQAADPTLWVLLFVLAGLAFLCLAGRLLLKNEQNRKRNLNLLLGAVLLHCAVFCTAWNLLAESALRADPLYIHVIAGGFATGDVSAGGMDYLYTYPHQAGQALLLELVYRIFGYENLLAFRMLNTLGVLVFVYSGYQVSGLLYGKDAVKVNFLLLSAGCVPLLIYTNVIYGEVLAAAAVMTAIWLLILWLREGKLRQFILMALIMGFAVCMKNNSLIAAVAVGGVMLCKAAAERRKKPAAFVIPLVLVLLATQPLMTRLYEYRSGWPLDQGMPKNLWVAMGLQGEGMTSGWWNEFPVRIYKEQAGYDPEAAKEMGNAAIAVSLHGFSENPKAAAAFFGRKFVSQWNDASYGCQVSAGSQDTPVLEFWMNGYHSLVFLGAAGFALFRFRRQKHVEECLPLLILLGGFLFHLAWEVKGRYGLFYFVLLLPAAAAGLYEIAGRLTDIRSRRKREE